MELSSADRVIVLVDMDCFYVQVEQKLCPEFFGKPCAVVQYKDWKGGGIIAVNYEARARGVTKFIRGDEAVEKCPDIHLFRVPEVRGKADLTRYREAGAKVLDVLCEFSDCVERASIDEAYLDMTSVINSRIQSTPPVTFDQLPNTFVIGWEGKDPESRKYELQKWLQMIYEEDHLYNDRMLAVAAVIVEEMRAAVYEKAGYRCSAGIAHNKMLAKLTCGINKPNKQTVLPQSSIQTLFNTIPIKKVRNLGGKLGKAVAGKFNAENMGDLIDVPKSQFVSHFGEKTGNWLYNLVRGVDNEQVTSRQLPKSIGCGKNFPGKSALSTRHDVSHWLKQLATELEERLIKDQKTNKRFARLLTVSIRNRETAGYALVSRSCPIHVYNAEKLAHDALMAINKLNTSSSDTLWKPCILTLSMAASKFEDRLDNSSCNIQSYLISNKSPESKVETRSKETSSSTSKTTFKSESNLKTVDSLNKSISQFSKNSEGSTKSITSFFSRKKIVAGESSENMNNSKNDDYIVKQKDDQNLGHINDQNLSSESDKNLSICCLVIDETDDDSGSDAKGKERSEENSNECIDNQIITQKVSPEQRHRSDQNFDHQDDQGSVSCLVIEESDEDSISCVTLGDVKRKEETAEENSSDSSAKPSKPMGFFAKKLAERAEFNFDFEFEPSCDGSTVSDEDNTKNVNTKNEPIAKASIISKPSTSSVQDFASDLDPELTKLCEQCNKRIPIWEETEHLDYHMAQSLSKELNKPVAGNSVHANKSSNPVAKSKASTNRKRGRATKSSSQAKKSFVQKNTLDAFIK